MNRAMSEQHTKIEADHLARTAYVYVRQSSPRQVQEHLESGRRQYERTEWACERGWPRERIVVIDEDQGKSSATAKSRPGFARLLGAVAGGEVGIVIALEVTRLARNSPDWHHLIYLCRFTGTLIADEHTVYDPALSADRMVLGIRGQMGELELESSIERMVSARWHKAERGELITIPPPGYEIDEVGELVMSADAALTHAIGTVFEKFDELGSARQVFLWWQTQGLKYPVRRIELRSHPVVWLAPSYGMVLRTLHNPIYAGAYVFGKSETVRGLGGEDAQTIEVRRVKRAEWPVLIRDHHPAYITFEQFLENQARMRSNAVMGNGDQATESGAVREGPALLQGLVMCGCCGRKMHMSYGGQRSHRVYQYRCSGARQQRGATDCQVIGGKRIDQTVVEVFLEATQPCAVQAARQANEEAHRQGEALRLYWAHGIEKAQYEAQRAERQYMAVEPENRVVARELERRWNLQLEALERVKREAEQALQAPTLLSDEELKKIHLLGTELRTVWEASTTTNRDRKRLLRCLIEEVQLRTEEHHHAVRIVWKGGAVTEREAVRGKPGCATRTPQDTVALVRELAQEFDDAQIARILNKQGRRSGLGNAFTQQSVTSLRGKHGIAKCPKQIVKDPVEGPFTAEEAARELGVTMSTVHRWLREGVLAGEQLTPGAPWRIVLSAEVRKRLSGGEAPKGWVGLSEAARRLGVSKSQVAYWVKTGKLNAVQATVGKRRCWRIEVDSASCGKQDGLFDQMINVHREET
jgi:DNA invertase Pin-like site-specific DNA recombinase